MAKAKISRRGRGKLPQSIVLILACGRDFFHDLDGDVDDHLPLLRSAWRDPEIRQAVLDRRRRDRQGPPWAGLVFDKRMSPDDAREMAGRRGDA